MPLPTGRQIIAARGLLGWNQKDLAHELGMTASAVASIESETNRSGKTLEKIERIFDRVGIEILTNGGVQPKQDFSIYTGQKGFLSFTDDVYETAKTFGGEICVSNVNEQNFREIMGKEAALSYMESMKKAHEHQDFNFKIIIQEGDDFWAASKYAEYKWASKEQFSDVPFYVYGDKLAIILFQDEVKVYVIHERNVAKAYRIMFDLQWNRAFAPTKVGYTDA